MSNLTASEFERTRRDSRPLNVASEDAALRVRWPAVFAGLVVTLGAWTLLTVAGLAAGLSAADPTHAAESLKSAGWITGVWSLMVPLVSLLAGGLVSARAAGVVSRPTSALHGVVLWGLATIASVVTMSYVAKGVMGTAASLGSGLAGAAGAMASQATTSMSSSRLFRAEDALAPINERLRSEGKPQVTMAQLEAATKDIVSTGLSQGHVDRTLVVDALANSTQLSRKDAEDIAMRVETTAAAKSSEVADDVQTGLASAADSTGKALWWVSLGMVVGLAASVAGSMLGLRRGQQLATRAFGGSTGRKETAHAAL